MSVDGELVILVDRDDRQIGVFDKLRAHQEGRLHRAFSIFLFNSDDELLLQQRAQGKYHCGGLWSNTCCSHPRPGEETRDAAIRRLTEEMALAAPVRKAFDFVYRACLDNHLVEHEFDHVFLAACEQDPRPDPGEVAQYRWSSMDNLRKAVCDEPQDFTPWFHIALERAFGCWQVMKAEPPFRE